MHMNVRYFSLKFSLSTLLFLERGKTLVQRKPTMYPAWKASFDAHIYEGRVLEVLLMKTAEEPLAEVTVGVSVLAERCKKANGRAEFWVWHYCYDCPLYPQSHVSCCLCHFSVCSGGSPSFWESDDGSAVLSGRRGCR